MNKSINRRSEFHIPKFQGEETAYFCGNSLGLQPISASDYLNQELRDWAEFGVEGHFEAKRPWFSYHEFATKGLCHLTGAQPREVAAMGSLTANLHLMMVSFYRPTKTRFKILIEGGAFPSDQYAVASQAKLHGFDPNAAIVELKPQPGEHVLRQEDIELKIQDLGESLALILIGGVNYYTGQAFDMEAITRAGHAVGATVGFDLAHAIGNIRLHLHDWGVDFAAWCTYKYLNSGPGAVGGIFVHEKWAEADLPRFAGWWGNSKANRFKMLPHFDPTPGADGWQLSNAPVMGMAAHLASLEIFLRTDLDLLNKESMRLHGLLRDGINGEIDVNNPFGIEILTPIEGHGAQLSLLTNARGKVLFEELGKQGVVADWRNPNVIRIAAAPLYNNENDIQRFVNVLIAAGAAI